MRSSHGRKPIFTDPDQLWGACCEYFDYVVNTPLMAAELVKHAGKYKTAKLPKMRAMTLTGLCLFLDISQETWGQYRKQKDFSEVCTRAEGHIFDYKFCGAAAELLNPAIIARDLGLADKKEHSGKVTLEELVTGQVKGNE